MELPSLSKENIFQDHMLKKFPDEVQFARSC